MTRRAAVFVCADCGHQSSKWFGQCPACREWNTAAEMVLPEEGLVARERAQPIPLVQLADYRESRLSTGYGEVDRTLGGGLVPGSVVLLAGEPGVGKSTLLLQVADKLAAQGPVLYVSGEESAPQLWTRFRRLGLSNPQVVALPETDVEAVCDQTALLAPCCVMVDSIQAVQDPGLASVPGSLAQVRQCSVRLTREAKERGVPMFIVGHITKEGLVAGPKALEHLVDTVLQFEGERTFGYRVLRTLKNRFGSADEIGLFEMGANGLEEVTAPIAFAHSPEEAPPAGSCVTCLLEGSRPLLVEVQALVVPARFGTPRRLTSGVDPRRAAIVLAVLEKRAGVDLAQADVYLNLAGGIRCQESALDLAVAVAVASSVSGVAVVPGTIACGEIALSGRLRPVRQIGRRVSEARRAGFSRFILPGARPEEKRGQSALLAPETLEQALALALASARFNRGGQ